MPEAAQYMGLPGLSTGVFASRVCPLPTAPEGRARSSGFFITLSSTVFDPQQKLLTECCRVLGTTSSGHRTE